MNVVAPAQGGRHRPLRVGYRGTRGWCRCGCNRCRCRRWNFCVGYDALSHALPCVMYSLRRTVCRPQSRAEIHTCEPQPPPLGVRMLHAQPSPNAYIACMFTGSPVGRLLWRVLQPPVGRTQPPLRRQPAVWRPWASHLRALARARAPSKCCPSMTGALSTSGWRWIYRERIGVWKG